jgi:hypothetical protein
MPKKKWFWNHMSDSVLQRMYDPTAPGRSQMLADRLKVPRWAVNRRAAALGLSRPKERPWSPDEEAYLESNFHHISVKAFARRFGRSPTAVRLKAKRLGLHKHDECYTACSLAQALGVDPHWVLARIRSGKLRASHRQIERRPEQGGDSWLITDDAVIDLIRDHPYDLDLRKVDGIWFMDLIAPYISRTGVRQMRAA